MGKTPKKTSNYLEEPNLNSELILINNAKKLKDNPSLLNEEHVDEIMDLRGQFTALSNRDEMGLQKQKRVIRDRIRDLSYITYTDRDQDLFGKMILTAINRIASRPQFSGYTYLDEMKSLSVQHIFLYTWKFDPYKQSKITGQYASAFAYISTIIFNAFIATIIKMKKEQEKAKADWLEHNKLIHRDPNKIVYDEEYTTAHRHVKLSTLEPEGLIEKLKSMTINEEIEFTIPKDYKITEKEYNFIIKYHFNISIKRSS